MSHRSPYAPGLYGYGSIDNADAMAMDGDAGAASQSLESDLMMLFFDDPTSFLEGFDPDPASALAGPAPLFTAPAVSAADFPAGPSAAISNAAAGAVTGGPSLAETAGTTGPSGSSGPDAGPEPNTELEPDPGGAAIAGANTGVHGGNSSSSTLTEFTRRKNWPAKVVEELRDLLMIIEPSGRVRFTSPSVVTILGMPPDKIAGQLLSDLIHRDDRAVFTAELNASIANGSMLRMYFRLRRDDDTYAIVESVGHPHIAEPQYAPNPSNKSPFCQAVFLMCRPYPTKNSGLLDSFLEHKMENERLRRRIEDLRHEEASEDRDNESRIQSQTNIWRQSVGSRSDFSGYNVGISSTAAPAALGHRTSSLADSTMSMAPPPLPPQSQQPYPGQPTTLSNAALTRENLAGIADRRPDSLRDKMARYEDGVLALAASSGHAGSGPMGTATHADTIEMLTGLRYLEGERSRGLSTGNRSPRLVKGDAGIAFSIDREQWAGEKKKKIRLAEEYVCTDCGTLESPEWRKGPNGPKTLCNACGLRWAKKEKKEKKMGQAADAPRAPSPDTL